MKTTILRYHSIQRRPGLLAALLLITTLLALCLPSARAQRAFLDPVGSLTNAIPATTTNAVTHTVIDMEAYDEFALLLLGKLTGAGTSAVTYDVHRSIDNTNWLSAFTIAVTANGTTQAFIHTNVTCGAFRFWKIATIGNANANAWTNAAAFTAAKSGVKRYSK